MLIYQLQYARPKALMHAVLLESSVLSYYGGGSSMVRLIAVVVASEYVT